MLPPETEARIQRVVDEFRAQALLARHGLTPKSRLLFVGPPGCGKLMQLRLRSVRKRRVDLEQLAGDMLGFSYADAERVCLEATKAMVLKGAKEMTQELLERELAEQRVRLALAKGRPDQTT